jgi:hypothetical protein
MASAGARAYMGVWGPCPQRGPGAEPLVRGSGGLCPLKLKAFCLYESKFRLEICSFLLSFKIYLVHKKITCVPNSLKIVYISCYFFHFLL